VVRNFLNWPGSLRVLLHVGRTSAEKSVIDAFLGVVIKLCFRNHNKKERQPKLTHFDICARMEPIPVCIISIVKKKNSIVQKNKQTQQKDESLFTMQNVNRERNRCKRVFTQIKRVFTQNKRVFAQNKGLQSK